MNMWHPDFCTCDPCMEPYRARQRQALQHATDTVAYTLTPKAHAALNSYGGADDALFDATAPVPFTLTPKALAALDAPPSLWRHVATLTAWLDATNPRTDHEVACRLLKLGEETGEVVTAYLGMTGQNPRKGTCATLTDLTAEQCDVIVTAMVALATVTGDAEDAETRLQRHVSARFDRLLARIDATTEPLFTLTGDGAA